MSKGFVYILSNPCLPGMVKIGMTTGNPINRAAQLSTTGVPENFVLEKAFGSPDCATLEQMVHCNLDDARVSPNREFFRLSVDEAIKLVRSSHATQISEWLDEFSDEYTLVDRDGFVDPSDVYFLADECGEDVSTIVMAIGEISSNEIKPAIDRIYKRMIAKNSVKDKA